MRRIRHLILLALLCLMLLPVGFAMADCPANLITNPGFEEGAYKTEGLGTSLSSNLGTGWVPWSILGDATYNREVEYKRLEAPDLPSLYHLHSGNHAQKFFTTWGTHDAGFYQRIAVTPGSKVTYSIWAQIYTGERELRSGGHFISDLEWPTESGQKRGPGAYKVYVGIDPYGDTPPGFGAPPSTNTVWSAPVTDFETRRTDGEGHEIDAWVQISVSTIAQRDYVTVYTKGQPLYPVKHNDSYWDDACLVAIAPPTATPKPTLPPTFTPVPTARPLPTETPVPTERPLPTETPVPTERPLPTDTAVPIATDLPKSTMAPALPTATHQPTETSVRPTAAPEPSATPSPQRLTSTPIDTQAPTVVAEPTARPARPSLSRESGLILIYVGTGLLLLVVVLWLIFGRRQ